MAGNDEIVPGLDGRTRQLIFSLVETGIESALATRATSLAYYSLLDFNYIWTLMKASLTTLE
jgi:hypothetical protein